MSDQETPLTPKPLPPVQRLSRAVLIVVAGLVTLTLLAVAFLATPRPLPRPQPLSRPPAAAEPGFLQRPPATPPPGRPELSDQEVLRRLLGRGPQPPAGGRPPWPTAGRGGDSGDSAGEAGDAGRGLRYNAGRSGSLGTGAGDGGDLGNAGGARDAGEAGIAGGIGDAGIGGRSGDAEGTGDAGDGAGVYPGGARRRSGPAPQARDLRREAFLRALRAPLAPPAAAAPPRAAPWPPPPPSEAPGLVGGGAGAPWSPAAPALRAAAPSRALPAPQSLAVPDLSAAEQGAAAAPFVAGPWQRGAVLPSGPVLPAGTVIAALLLTAVNSDLPGPLMAQVSRDVYDLHQRAVILPRGTRLLGRYENRVAVGQRRLLVAWTRLQLLDGTLLELPGLPGNDGGGAAGIPARPQNHLLRVFGDAVLLSLLSAGAELAQPPPRSLVSAPSAGSVASAAVGQQLSEVGLQLLRRDLSIQPTLRLPAGTPLTVFVNADLPLAPPPADGERR